MPFFFLHMLLHFKRSKYTQIWLLTWMFGGATAAFLKKYCTLKHILTHTKMDFFHFLFSASSTAVRYNSWIPDFPLKCCFFKAVFLKEQCPALFVFVMWVYTACDVCFQGDSLECILSLAFLQWFCEYFWMIHLYSCITPEIYVLQGIWNDNASRKVSQCLQKRVISELLNS